MWSGDGEEGWGKIGIRGIESGSWKEGRVIGDRAECRKMRKWKIGRALVRKEMGRKCAVFWGVVEDNYLKPRPRI